MDEKRIAESIYYKLLSGKFTPPQRPQRQGKKYGKRKNNS